MNRKLKRHILYLKRVIRRQKQQERNGTATITSSANTIDSIVNIRKNFIEMILRNHDIFLLRYNM